MCPFVSLPPPPHRLDVASTLPLAHHTPLLNEPISSSICIVTLPNLLPLHKDRFIVCLCFASGTISLRPLSHHCLHPPLLRLDAVSSSGVLTNRNGPVGLWPAGRSSLGHRRCHRARPITKGLIGLLAISRTSSTHFARPTARNSAH